MMAMYFVVALTIGESTARLREKRFAEQKREENSRALYLFTRELADADDRQDIIERVIHQIGSAFDAEVALVFQSGGQNGAQCERRNAHWQLSDGERQLALQAVTGNQSIDLEVNGGEKQQVIYVPLAAGASPMGALVLRLRSICKLDRNQRDLLDNFANQTALVLDRQRLREAEVKTRLLAESERLGRTLLNSVSHELRTPLAAIATAVATLRNSGQLSPLHAKLSSEIDSAVFRLNRVVQSLLSAARIQSGQVKPKLDWCDLADVIRVVLRDLEGLLKAHRIEQHIQRALPLVRGDFVLLQQALSNLLLNAATYTPKGTVIELNAEVNASEAVIRVADHGPGLPHDQIDRIFDLFHRAPGAKPGGTGLGLGIVKGFMEAQGGRVQASNRPEGGALFSVFLPVRESPEISEESP